MKINGTKKAIISDMLLIWNKIMQQIRLLLQMY